MEEKKYTVYMHITPNKKCYIGVTKQKVNRRWGNGSNYSNNKYFTNAIKKYGWQNIEHKILFENLTKKQAEKKEIELIKQYNSNDLKYGYNILSGGNVMDGVTEEIRKKIADKKRGKNLTKEHKEKIKNSLKGRKMTDEWKEKISNSLKGKKKNEETILKISLSKKGTTAWNKGKHNIYTKEQINNLSNKTKDNWRREEYRNKNTKKVMCIEFNMIFDSITEAKKYFNMESTSHISECCLGKLKSCGKYNGEKLHWKYIEEE